MSVNPNGSGSNNTSMDALNSSQKYTSSNTTSSIPLPLSSSSPDSSFPSSSSSSSSVTSSSAVVRVDPPVTKLFFEPYLIAASPHNLQTVQLWPFDNAIQILLTSISNIASEKQIAGGAVLTCPASIGVAGLAIRMAGYLLREAVHSNKPIKEISASNLPLPLQGVREIALQQLQQGGWSAATSLPRILLQRWWSAAKELLKADIPEALNYESEQVVCAAYMCAWIRLVLDALGDVAREAGSPLITLGMLDVKQWEQRIPKLIGVVETIKQLGGCAVPPFDSSGDETTVRYPFYQQSFDSAFTLVEAAAQKRLVEFTLFDRDTIRRLENIASRKILENIHWYHSKLVRKVAQEFASGQRKSHPTDQVLREWRINPLKIDEVDLPQNVFGCHAGGGAAPQERRVLLRLEIADANERDWYFVFSLGGSRASLRQQGNGSPFEVASITFAGNTTSVVSSSHLSEHSVLKDFEPRLDDGQRKSLAMLEQAYRNGLNESHRQITDALKVFNSSQPPLVNLVGAQPDDVRQNFGSANHSAFVQSTAIEHWKSEVRSQQFQQIALLSLELADYQRWGFCRYTHLQTDTVRQVFQSHLLDAVMQLHGMELMPVELHHIIAEFWTIESLPYLMPEEVRLLNPVLESDTVDP